MRIQKFLSEAGIVSRRKAEKLISEGKITVNGEIVRELWKQIDPEKDCIKLDNKIIKRKQKKIYILLFKPKGYVTTLKDEKGRPTVGNLLKDIKFRVFPVGRLDYNTEGLLILTNDGDISQKMSHPRYGLPKTYMVKVSGILNEKALKRLKGGVKLADGKTLPAELKIIKTLKNSCWLEITIREGKRRQIRRMFEMIGHPVRKLKRTKIGFLNLEGLLPGEYRYLSSSEIELLKKEIQKA